MMQLYGSDWKKSVMNHTKSEIVDILGKGLRGFVERIATLKATVKRLDDVILTLTDDNEKQEQKIAALEAKVKEKDKHEDDYQRVIGEILLCNPIPACQRLDDTLEPPWEVIKRMREQIAALTTTISERDEEIERLRGAVQAAIIWEKSAGANFSTSDSMISFMEDALKEAKQ